VTGASQAVIAELKQLIATQETQIENDIIRTFDSAVKRVEQHKGQLEAMVACALRMLDRLLISEPVVNSTENSSTPSCDHKAHVRFQLESFLAPRLFVEFVLKKKFLCPGDFSYSTGI
jgi:hypothetical protein